MLEMGAMMYIILGAATGIKAALWLYCVALRKQSDSMMALAEDHRNDMYASVTATPTRPVLTRTTLFPCCQFAICKRAVCTAAFRA